MMFKGSNFWFKQQSVKSFSTRLSVSNIDIRCSPQLPIGCQEIIKQYLQGDKTAVTVLLSEPNREVVMLEAEKKYVFKRSMLSGFNKRLKNTLTIAKVYGYPGLYNELINSQKANQTLSNTPRVAGYGVSKQFGLVNEEFLLFEFIEDCVPIDELFLSGQYPVEQLLDVVVDEYVKALDHQVIHLDLHPKNLLVSKDLTERWIIDFEQCSFVNYNNSSSLGFLLGYFHYYWVHKYIDGSDYDEYIKQKVTAIESLDLDVFWPVFNMFKNKKVSRKTRYASFICKESNDAIITTAKEFALVKS
ncbi:RIO1 family regulatory kinase/ATPase domain-containing protein [Spartinivicinus ruber]|uniref:RIO1 family regulatory kinase/ATPase domain-containing protein n=1 Tax=Spartinivicinus ruber TaxID=2683272 RepID=UPI0013D4F3CB|nr:RIO1 family regulatory kinase/ATPase [Spartinivicinus ruber]